MAAISVTATMVPVGERVVVLTRGMPGQPPGPDGLLGIGVSFVPASDGQRHVIISVAEKGSAFSSGKVFVGDVIISVDGHITAGLPVPDVVKKMKGPPGTQVTIVFEHVGQSAFPQPGQVGTMTQAQQQQNAPSLRHVGTISPAPQHISAPHFQPSPAQHASPVHHAEPPVPQPMHSPLPKTPGSPEHQQFPTITAATLASPARVDNEPYHPPAPVPDAPLEGYHTKAWPDGKSYQGYFQNGMRHGKGVIKYPDGAMYDGEWKDDLRDGYGKYIYADGTSFQGEWKRGCRHGKGICVYSDGNTYEGDWVDSVPHGQGKCSFAQGGVYAGSFEVGKMHGFGTLRSSDGSILFQGEWRDGETVQPPAQVNPVDPPNHQPAYMGSPAPPPQIAPVYTDPYASSYQNSPPQTAQNNSYITSAPGGGGGGYLPPSQQSNYLQASQQYMQPAMSSTVTSSGKRSGVGLKLAGSPNGDVKIDKIQVGSAAGLDGSLQPGDVIVRMDGVQVSSLEQARELSQGPDGSSVRIEAVRNTGGWVSVTLQRRSLNSADARASLRMSTTMSPNSYGNAPTSRPVTSGRPKSGEDNCKVQ